MDRLVARFEAFARTASRLPHPDAQQLVERATVATMRAMALELLQADRAAARWSRAYASAPAPSTVEETQPERLAA